MRAIIADWELFAENREQSSSPVLQEITPDTVLDAEKVDAVVELYSGNPSLMKPLDAEAKMYFSKLNGE
jgi:hypothetical protein